MKNRLILKDFYTATTDTLLTNQGSVQDFGRAITEYQVYKHIDLTNLSRIRGYVLNVRQRLIIPNATPYVIGASSVASYDGYPAIIENKFKLNVSDKATLRISNIFPRTLNSTVSTTSTSLTGTSSSVMQQNSAGSANTNVNTFGVELSGGAFGEIPIFGISLSYSHSWINEVNSQKVSGNVATNQSEKNFSTSMSVKDWSAYSRISNDETTLSWIWGQSYPWDVILYNQSSGGDNINLPQFIKDRLISDGLIRPPSELSLFGLDFTSGATWYIDFPNDTDEPDTASVQHETILYTASHRVDGGVITAKLQSTAQASYARHESATFDLRLYSLAPLNLASGDRPGSIAFNVDRFFISPQKSIDTFSISSTINDIFVSGTGFNAYMCSDLTSDTTFSAYFKVSDFLFEYTLYLTHWIDQNSGPCMISWNVNGEFLGSITLNQMENGKGQDNTNVISLRKVDDLTSKNCHDYLTLGLNFIKFTVTPINPKQPCQYFLSALEIR